MTRCAAAASLFLLLISCDSGSEPDEQQEYACLPEWSSIDYNCLGVVGDEETCEWIEGAGYECALDICEPEFTAVVAICNAAAQDYLDGLLEAPNSNECRRAAADAEACAGQLCGMDGDPAFFLVNHHRVTRNIEECS